MKGQKRLPWLTNGGRVLTSSPEHAYNCRHAMCVESVCVPPPVLYDVVQTQHIAVSLPGRFAGATRRHRKSRQVARCNAPMTSMRLAMPCLLSRRLTLSAAKANTARDLRLCWHLRRLRTCSYSGASAAHKPHPRRRQRPGRHLWNSRAPAHYKLLWAARCRRTE